MSQRLVIRTPRRRPWSGVARAVAILVTAAFLPACDGGGSGQSGSAFVFVSVDSFSVSGSTTPAATVTSSNIQTTTTSACVTLRNNLKNPTLTAGTALDNVTIQSYTVTYTTLIGGGIPGPFTFQTAVLVPAGTVATGVVTNNTATFPVILVPAGAKGSPGTVATAQVTFRGRDGRGNSVETEGAVTVQVVAGGTDSSCAAATTTTT